MIPPIWPDVKPLGVVGPLLGLHPMIGFCASLGTQPDRCPKSEGTKEARRAPRLSPWPPGALKPSRPHHTRTIERRPWRSLAAPVSPRILPELRLAEICADRIKPGNFEGSAPNQRRLAIIFRSGGVVHCGNIFSSRLLPNGPEGDAVPQL